MTSKFEDTIQLILNLKYTSFGIEGKIHDAETSIKKQTKSLTDFKESYKLYYEGIQDMESNICSKFTKISIPLEKPAIPLENYALPYKIDNRPEYTIDIEKMKNSTSLLDASENFVNYLWDRWPGQFALHQEQVALRVGMAPELAKLAGDFSGGMLFETSVAIEITGIKSYKCLKTSGNAFQWDIYAGSGLGNVSKGVGKVEDISPEKLLGIEHANINSNKMQTVFSGNIPKSKIAAMPQRQLLPNEITVAKQHLNDIVARRFGNIDATNRLALYREHALTDMRNIGGDNFQGWKSLDLIYDELNPNNHGIMRLLYKEINVPRSGIEWKVIQMH